MAKPANNVVEGTGHSWCSLILFKMGYVSMDNCLSLVYFLMITTLKPKQ